MANRYQARPTKITDFKNDRGAKAANPSPHAPDERSGHFSCIPNTNEPQDLPQDLPDKNGTGPEDLNTHQIVLKNRDRGYKYEL